ncbi:MAG: ATP/GTP-binding protein [Cyanobacteria bacterium P01_F01_bin.86]
MKVVRLVVTGPVGAGKSTFVRNISEVEALETDRPATSKPIRSKRNITVAMDFGQLRLNPHTVLHLYGTPGQSRFDFMWDILIKHAHAYVMLVPSNLPSEFGNAKLILDFMQQRARIPMVIGLTHQDCKDAWGAVSIAIALGIINQQEKYPIIDVNATNKRSIAKAIVAVLSQEKVKNWTLSK